MTTWEKPNTYIPAADDKTMSAALMIQGRYRIRAAKKKFGEKMRVAREKNTLKHDPMLDSKIEKRVKRLRSEQDMALSRTTDRWYVISYS